MVYIKCICCMCGMPANNIAVKSNEFLCDKCLEIDKEIEKSKLKA